jgi:hypothetical protein
MNTRLEKLTCKVAAINRANAYGKEIYQTLTKIFEPLVGEKILKVDGSLLAKYAALVPKFEYSHALHVYRHSSDYSLAWTVKTCEPLPPGSCMYHESTVYIGDLRGGMLDKLAIYPFDSRSDFTVEEITQKRVDFENAKKALDEARSALYPFGEYDN